MHPTEIKVKAGQMIAEGKSKKEIAKALNVPYRTLISWVMAGDRLVVGGDPARSFFNAALRGDIGADGSDDGAASTAGGSSYSSDNERDSIAREAGLDPRWVSRLVGNSREELLADARSLAEVIPDRSPVPGLGVRGAPISGAPSMNDLIRQAAGRVVVSS